MNGGKPDENVLMGLYGKKQSHMSLVSDTSNNAAVNISLSEHLSPDSHTFSYCMFTSMRGKVHEGLTLVHWHLS